MWPPLLCKISSKKGLLITVMASVMMSKEVNTPVKKAGKVPTIGQHTLNLKKFLEQNIEEFFHIHIRFEFIYPRCAAVNRP